MFPKSPRVIDPAAIAAYKAAHSRCEVLGCEVVVAGEPHHLVSRKRLGGDVPENLLTLCVGHHMEWHAGGRETWLRKYRGRLAPDALAKVEAVVGKGR